MGIFGSDKRGELKHQIIDLYTSVFTPIMGSGAKKMVMDMVKVFEKQIKDSGADKLPENFGEIVVGKLYKEQPQFGDYAVDKAYADGATKTDIIEYYNLDYLQRLMVEWSEQMFRFTTYNYFVDDQKLSSADAMSRVRSMFPMYGDPNNTTNTQGDDRPLSEILRGRVDLYRESHGADEMQRASKPYSSFNAYVRFLIRRGEL